MIEPAATPTARLTSLTGRVMQGVEPLWGSAVVRDPTGDLRHFGRSSSRPCPRNRAWSHDNTRETIDMCASAVQLHQRNYKFISAAPYHGYDVMHAGRRSDERPGGTASLKWKEHALKSAANIQVEPGRYVRNECVDLRRKRSLKTWRTFGIAYVAMWKHTTASYLPSACTEAPTIAKRSQLPMSCQPPRCPTCWPLP
ncbi:uncharacterized protein CC84DRAFT_467164 [Paraphaeosphaeria sporulosa]|uniref:Uncharacterized protein n=1 Tax=Paraphaeosphaeria sporulosa TaxID=1460663 RepID=A0A177CTC0_9PLEO|nr:uncharacterized protein CC84DRAFT_467164 [Paraphaeosphaeria sporulosa]OAG10162.1 hypothetical protein CC84DRAFT_467164 [Paraphaeosphaeria sporulosa]